MFEDSSKSFYRGHEVSVKPVDESILTIDKTRFRYDPTVFTVDSKLLEELIPYVDSEEAGYEFDLFMDDSLGLVVY